MRQLCFTLIDMVKKILKKKVSILYLPLLLVVGIVWGLAYSKPGTLPVTKSGAEGVESETTTIDKLYFDFDVETQSDTTSYLKMAGMPSSEVGDIGYNNEVQDYDEVKMMSRDFGMEPIVREADLDNDGVVETIILKASSLKNSPNILYVVKDKKIVFESAPMSFVGYSPSPASNGFYLDATPDDEVGTGYRVIRIVWKDGKFVPVWQQRVRFFKYL